MFAGVKIERTTAVPVRRSPMDDMDVPWIEEWPKMLEAYIKTLTVGQPVQAYSGGAYDGIVTKPLTAGYIEVEVKIFYGPPSTEPARRHIRFDSCGKAVDSRDIYEDYLEGFNAVCGVPWTEWGPWSLILPDELRLRKD